MMLCERNGKTWTKRINWIGTIWLLLLLLVLSLQFCDMARMCVCVLCMSWLRHWHSLTVEWKCLTFLFKFTSLHSIESKNKKQKKDVSIWCQQLLLGHSDATNRIISKNVVDENVQAQQVGGERSK